MKLPPQYRIEGPIHRPEEGLYYWHLHHTYGDGSSGPVGDLTVHDEPHREGQHAGHHPIDMGFINQEHRGLGLYQHMTAKAADDLRAMGSSGLVSLGADRNPKSDAAWSNDRAATRHEGDDGKRDFRKSQLAKGAAGDWQNEGYSFSHKFNDDHPWGDGLRELRVHAHDRDGKHVGWYQFSFEPHEQNPETVGGGELNIENARTRNDHQRKGLATGAYQYAEDLMGEKVVSAGEQSEDAQALWNQPARPFGKSLPARRMLRVTRVPHPQNPNDGTLRLVKSVKPKDWKSISGKLSGTGQQTVDHTAHAAEHPVAPEYKQMLESPKAVTGEKPAEYGGISAKMIHKIPELSPAQKKQQAARNNWKLTQESPEPPPAIDASHQNTWMAKPYHKKIESHTRSWVKHPILGWATMATKQLMHAAGLGDATEDVAVHEHQGVPMTVHKFGRDYKPIDNSIYSAGHKSEIDPLQHQKILAMDWLTGNLDRHHGNVLISQYADARGYHQPLLIDHERNFQYIRGQLNRDIWADRPTVNNLHGQRQNSAFRFLPFRNMGPEEFHEWWKEKGPDIKTAFDKEIEHIKDPRIKEHVRRNFEHRHNYLNTWAGQMDEGEYSDPFERSAKPVRVIEPPRRPAETVKRITGDLPRDHFPALEQLNGAMQKRRTPDQHQKLLDTWRERLKRASPMDLVSHYQSGQERRLGHNDGGKNYEIVKHIGESNNLAAMKLMLERHDAGKLRLAPLWEETFREKLKGHVVR